MYKILRKINILGFTNFFVDFVKIKPESCPKINKSFSEVDDYIIQFQKIINHSGNYVSQNNFGRAF